MITRADADVIAARWAHRESLRRGFECRPVVEEFDLGFAVWTQQPASVLAVPGEGATTVIDRETGRLSHWPQVPTAVVEEMYRERRPALVDPPLTADPEVEVRRDARRRVSPSIAAHLTLDGRLFIARGAKGDQRLHHHPLVVDQLRRAPAGSLVRGAERHAELLVLSDVLHEIDRVRAGQGRGPIPLAEARAVLRDARFETLHIREAGDPVGGTPAHHCESCIEVLVDMALLPWAYTVRTAERKLDGGDDPQPGRFPPMVAWQLSAGGWQISDRAAASARAEEQLALAEAVPGQEHRLEPFPAAVAVLAEFGRVASFRLAVGTAQRVRFLEINTRVAMHTADLLHEFGELIGARMFPIGSEGIFESVLAADEHGRVFALDQGGEWFVGEDIDATLTTLITGGYTPRVRDDGTWDRGTEGGER